MSAIASSSRSIIISAGPSIRRSILPHICARTFSSSSSHLEANYYNAWSARAHRKRAPTIPPPLPALFKQTVSLADGSIIYMNSTAPSPQIIRLTRDVTNNPVWSPGSKSRGLDEDLEGAVGRFRRRFEGMNLGGTAPQPRVTGDGDGPGAVDEAATSPAPETDNWAWMSEGGKEEKAPKVPEKKAASAKGGKKK